MFYPWLIAKIKENNLSAKEFMVWNGRSFNYGWLLGQVEIYKKELKDRAIDSGAVCAIDGDYSPHMTALFLALIENRNIVVPISTTATEKKKYYLRVSGAEVIFTFDNQNVSCLKVSKTAALTDNELLIRLKSEGHCGLVLFTSGSTSIPKAALHNLDTLLSSYLAPKRSMRTLAFLRFDHIGGINTLFSVIANGGTMVVVKDREPGAVCQVIEEYAVELLPTTPSFLSMLLISESYKDYDLSSLKLVTYGTEVMPEGILKRLHQTMPRVEFKQTYGLTEVGILRTKSKSSESPWVKLGGENTQFKIVKGVLWVKSDTSILGYLNASNPFSEDGWLVTNDMVSVEGEFLKFLGRQEDIINVGGLKVYPAEVEEVILQMDNVSDAVVCAEKNPILGNIVCARIVLKHPETQGDFKKKLYDFCKNKLERHKIPQKIEISTAPLVAGERYKKIRRAI